MHNIEELGSKGSRVFIKVAMKESCGKGEKITRMEHSTKKISKIENGKRGLRKWGAFHAQKSNQKKEEGKGRGGTGILYLIYDTMEGGKGEGCVIKY